MNKTKNQRFLAYSLGKNKKGAEKFLSVYWFIILILIAAGISAMVFTFYKHPYDIREVEANILLNKVADCISNQGVISKEVLNETGDFQNGFSIEQDCKISFITKDYADWNLNDEYYVEVKIFDISNQRNPRFPLIVAGNNNLISGCELQQKKEEKKISKCIAGDFYSLDLKNRQYVINILSIVRKGEKNVI